MADKNCFELLKSKLPALHQKLRDKVGEEYSESTREKYIQAAKELQQESIKNIEDIHRQLGIETQPNKGKGEPPIEPPKEPLVEGERERGEVRRKGILTHLYEAKNIPEHAREGFKKEGLDYQTKDQEEAESVAKSVIDEFGIDESVRYAEEQKFDGDVNSLIFAESLNRIAEQEIAAKTPEEKLAFAEKFKDIGITYDQMGRKGGRFNAAIGYWYKKSPLGMVLKQNAENKTSFDKWAKPKEKSWEEFFTELNNLPEFKEFVGKKVAEELKTERAEQRKERKEKIHNAIDSLTTKWAKALSIKNKDDIQKQGFGDIDKVMKSVGATMKAAYDAGEAIKKVIDDAIQTITEFVEGKAWDIDTFRKESESLLMKGYESKSSLDRYKDRLKKEIESLDKQIEEKKRIDKKKNKTELDEEAKGLVEKRNEKKKQLEEVAPLTESQEYQLRQLEKFRKKLSGLTEAQKDEVIRNSYTELIKNGALKNEDFRKIIAKATGKGDLDAKQIAKMKELVNHANAVEDFAKRLREQKTEKSFENYKKAQYRAAKSARELADMFDKKQDILRLLSTSLQGNTLTLTNAVLLNPAYNVVNHILVRLPNGAIQSIADMGIGLFNKNYAKEYNTVFSLSAQREFFKELGKGIKEAGIQTVTGLNRMDYIQKEIYPDQIRPFKSIRDISHQIRTNQTINDMMVRLGGKDIERKEQLTARQKVHRILQIFPGTPAEIIFRVLNWGDKPMRFGAGGATAAAFSKSLGLKFNTLDWKIFSEFPREEAYRILRKMGMDEKKAGEQADYIKEAIIQEGKRSTFQQDNLFVDFINGAFQAGFKRFGGAESGVASLVKATAISPYLKIPSNAFWSFFNLAHPAVAVTQATGHLLTAMKYRTEGNNVKAKLQIREARYWAGHAAIGIGLQMIIIPLVKNGIITPSQDDESRKERLGEQTYEPQGTINMTKLWAFMNGKNPNDVKNSFTVNLKWLGSIGMLSNAVGKDYEALDDEQKENRNLLVDNLFEFWDTDDLKEMQNGVFSNASSLFSALGQGGYSAERYFLGLTNLYSNLIQPASLAQIERAMLPYYSPQKADSFMKELDNAMLQRSWLYRELSGKYPPKKFNIWGEPMMKDNSFMNRIMGFNRVTKDNFAQPLYDDAKKYHDTGFFPPATSEKIGDTKLTTEQYEDRQQFQGVKRKMYIGAFINDLAEFPIVHKKYSELDPEQKKAAISYFSEVAREEGDEELFKKYPDIKPIPKTKEEKISDKLFSLALKVMKIQTESKK